MGRDASNGFRIQAARKEGGSNSENSVPYHVLAEGSEQGMGEEWTCVIDCRITVAGLKSKSKRLDRQGCSVLTFLG